MYKATIIGNLGQDAVYKDLNGNRYISFSLAHSERYKTADGQTVQRTVWFSCLKKGESDLIKYLRKGTRVYIEGSTTNRIYYANNAPQIGTNVNVSHLELLTAKENDSAGQEGNPPINAPAGDLPVTGQIIPLDENNDLPY